MSQLKVNSIIPTAGVPSGGAGGVIQTIFQSTTSQVTNTSGSDADTGVTATITPKVSTSKILIIANLQWELFRESTEIGGSFRLLRDSTVISQHDGCVHQEAGATGQSRVVSEGGYTIQVFDTPGDTNAHTYKVQFHTDVTNNNAHMRVSRNNAPSCITLQEVSA